MTEGSSSPARVNFSVLHFKNHVRIFFFMFLWGLFCNRIETLHIPGPSEDRNWGGLIFIYSSSALLISFEIDVLRFVNMNIRIHPPPPPHNYRSSDGPAHPHCISSLGQRSSRRENISCTWYDKLSSNPCWLDSSIVERWTGVPKVRVQVQLESTFTLEFYSLRNYVGNFLFMFLWGWFW